jgi:hypothetical protein
MNLTDIVKRFVEVAGRWTVGMTVWHRACGKRGIVVQYVVGGDGRVMLEVSFGSNQQMDRCLPVELSVTPVGEGGDGEEWKAGV